MELRILAEKDAQAFFNLRLEGLERDPLAFGEAAEDHKAAENTAAQRMRYHSPDASFVVGAFAGGILVGVVGFIRHQGAKNAHKGTVWGVYVTQNSRGTGVGRSLMTELIRLARAQKGLEQILLGVRSEDNAAKRLYTSLGFVPFGIETHALKIGDEYVDQDHMMLLL